MDTMLTRVEGAAADLDDIIMVGWSNEELTEWVGNFLTCIQDFGFYFWQEKR